MIEKLEKIISDALRKSPKIKTFLAALYLRICYCLALIKHLIKNHKSFPCKANSVTNDNGHYFFGYYDKTPWDKHERYLLCHKVDFADRMPKPGEAAVLGYIDLLNDNQWHVLGHTFAWCWQQGSMLQWLANPHELLVIHNDFKNDKYVSQIKNLKAETQKTLPLPVYSVSKDATQALSLNFTRLHYACPGYGYVAKPYLKEKQTCPDDDGIWHLDINTGEYKLIISLEMITKQFPKADFKNSFHYFNHLEFNPCASRMVFLHRWFAINKNGSRGKQFTRMFTADPDGANIYCLADHGMVSHFAWKNNDHILVWATHPSSGNRYYLFKDKTNECRVVGDGILIRDGHPSYSPDKKWILTDTYPNKARFRELIIYNSNSSKRIDLGLFKAPFKFNGPWRCDLHPRWNRNGRKVCFDSVHEGRRKVYLVDVSGVI